MYSLITRLIPTFYCSTATLQPIKYTFAQSFFQLPVIRAWWGPFSERAASGPLHPGCGWWQSKTSWSSAGGVWRRSACAWFSGWSYTVSLCPWSRHHSHYSWVLEGRRHTHTVTQWRNLLFTPHGHVIWFAILFCIHCFIEISSLSLLSHMDLTEVLQSFMATFNISLYKLRDIVEWKGGSGWTSCSMKWE